MPQAISNEYLTELFKAITQQKQTGVLRIEQVGKGSNEQGEIYFEDGRMFNARVGDERGKQALQRISTWEHTVYTFKRVSKPSSSKAPTSQVTTESTRAEELLARLLPAPPPQTEDLLRTRLSSSSEKTHPALDASEPVHLPQVKAAPTPMSQALILRGDTLEAYVPAPSASRPQTRQRWTTRRAPETETNLLVMPVKPPLMPRLDPPPGDAPGRFAIFRATATTLPTRSMQQMERRERLIFVLLDGIRTIQHIARLLHQTESEVEQVLLKLERSGLVEYVRG